MARDLPDAPDLAAPAANNDVVELRAWRRRARRRADWLGSALFAGGSIVAFTILAAFVFVAILLYARGH